MNKSEYLMSLHKAWMAGDISDEAYDAGVMNADIFCDDDELMECSKMPEQLLYENGGDIDDRVVYGDRI